ncbi:hemerythrin domain-containing protein [Candidatus Nitrospira neomarina]|uniref:Hemerythrin domain-containing protein n=1 Tax=Candidatus Nitrospira neomarina TaxID=3020899 RepID=A0AA96JXC0_9BACT|nr:hemerythrin domain-containing protein [Candidatus Nitrospira neomarina]WNM63792.1 hemerythrin domain-containing protein [Candidatus Nitrospira neomarina]
MNIYERLTQDHEKHRQLAKEIMGTTGDSADRRSLWDQFKPETVAHANAEEQSFYATLLGKPDAQEKARHSVSEHKKTDDAIKELDEMDMGTGGWIQKFEKLKNELDHHMDEEENEVFQKAKQVIDAGKADQLADDFEKRKRQELAG